MAKRAFFGGRGSYSYLSVPAPSGAIEGIGTGPYKVSFNYEIVKIASYTPEASPIIGNIQIFEDTIYVEGDSGDITVSGLTDNVEYLVEIERDSTSEVTITINSIISATGVDNTDWGSFDSDAASAGFWELWNTEWDRAWYLINDFKIWKDGVLVFNMPLSTNLSEIQSGLVVTDVSPGGIHFVDLVVNGTDPTNNLVIVTYFGGNWIIYPQPTHALISGNHAPGVLATGGSRRFELTIPERTSIESAYLMFYSFDLGGGIGLGGVGTKARFFAHKNTASPQITTLTQYEEICGSVFGYPDTNKTSDILYDDVDITISDDYKWNLTIDLKTIFQELCLLGEISSVNLFLTDHDGRSGTNKCYVIADSPAWELYPVLMISYGDPYSITYDGNGNTSGTVPVDSTNYIPLETVYVLSVGDLEKTGQSFSGWNTSPDGSGTNYQPGDNFQISSNITLYATWATPYYRKNVVKNNHGSFLCLADHLSSAINEPGVGANWRDYWIDLYPALHSDLTDIQGGDSTSTEFYHLTSEEHIVVQNTSGVNTGDQFSSDFYHNDLSGLQGGDSTSSEFYHLTEVEYNDLQQILYLGEWGT